MNALRELLEANNFYVDYDTIFLNKTLEKELYKHVKITCPNSPFDYFESFSLEEDGSVYACIFVEPVGSVGFYGTSFKTFFTEMNAFFNSQPSDMEYNLAGHKINYYARHVRKSMGMDFRYIKAEDVWAVDINADYEKSQRPSLSLCDVVTGRDLFTHIEQKNRVNIVIASDLVFFDSPTSEGMMGEIIYAQEMMPDFFKVLIDLSKFSEHNLFMLEHCSWNKESKEEFLKHQILEYFIPYEDKVLENDYVRLLKPEEVTDTIVFMRTFAKSDFDGDLEEYEAYIKKNSP